MDLILFFVNELQNQSSAACKCVVDGGMGADEIAQTGEVRTQNEYAVQYIAVKGM